MNKSLRCRQLPSIRCPCQDRMGIWVADTNAVSYRRCSVSEEAFLHLLTPERAGILIDDRRRVFFFCRTHCSTLALGLMCCFHAASPASRLCPAPEQARNWVLARPDGLRRATVLRPL